MFTPSLFARQRHLSDVRALAHSAVRASADVDYCCFYFCLFTLFHYATLRRRAATPARVARCHATTASFVMLAVDA